MERTQFVRAAKKLLVVFLILQILASNVFASSNLLSLYKNKESDNIPFRVENMFPGDYIKQDYCVRVSYNGTITVCFTADVRDGYEKLAEVLKCKVVMPEKNLILYDGYMSGMGTVPHTISAVNTTEDLKYEIAVYLDTSVGNAHQNLSLVADFRWWAETDSGSTDPDEPDPPGGGGGGGGGGPDKPDNPDNPPTDPDKPDNPDNPPTDPDSPGGNGTDNPDDPDSPDNPPTDPDDPDSPSTDHDKPSGGHGKPGDTEASGSSDDEVSETQNPDDEVEGEDVPISDEAGKTPTGELIDPPYTGDFMHPALYIALICISLFIIFLILFIKKKNKNEKNRTIKKLTIAIAVIIILAICLCVTTFALIYSITVDENIFRTGSVQINLNDGKPLITDEEFLLEPGMTVQKEFFIKNESSDSVYYKVYFDKVRGGLADVLDVTIRDVKTGKVMYSGKAGELTAENTEPEELFLNEKREFFATFHFPEESGNSAQNMSLEFDMCATATQTRNNPNREFD